VRERDRERQRERERETERDRESNNLSVCVYVCVCTIACERSKRFTKYPRPAVSCAAPAYLLYAPRDLITIFLYNLKTKRRTNFC